MSEHESSPTTAAKAAKSSRRRVKKSIEDITSPIPPCPRVDDSKLLPLPPMAADSAGFMLGFPPDLFRDHGSYYELTFAQRSPEWLDARKKRVTASIFAQAAGCSPYKTRAQLLREMAGVTKPADFAFFQRRAMENGTRLEPYVRDWYEVEYKKKVVERGLVIPKWCTRIGVSVDGFIEPPNDGRVHSKGIIEIKCPMNMYPELVDNSHRLEKGEKFAPLYHDHIKPDHYAQMQGGLAILDVDYCDYIVYVERTRDVYVTRILRDRDYWDTDLFPKLLSFVADMDELAASQNRETECCE